MGIKIYLGLFAIFLMLSSDLFITNVLSGFGEDAVAGRNPTAWGCVLQGVFLVAGYAVLIYLAEQQIL